MSNKRNPASRKSKLDNQKREDEFLTRRNLFLSIIVAVTVIISFAIELPKKISESLQVFPTSTQLAFPTAIKGETLIVVADLDDRAKNASIGVDPAQYIFEQLNSQIEKDNLPIQVKRLYQTVNENTVQDIGSFYNATLLVWGWYDTLTINPHVERIAPLKDRVSDLDKIQFQLAEPSKIDLGIINDLSTQTTNLALLILSLDRYWAGDSENSLHYLNSVIDNSTPQINNQEVLIWAHFYRGNIYILFRQDVTNAIQEYSKVLEIRPEHVMALSNRGGMYFLLKQYDIALNDFNKAIELEPNDSVTLYDRGATYAEKGDFDAAISDYNMVIQLNPNDAFAYDNRGIAYGNKNEFTKAILDYNTAIKLRPDVASFYFHRGNSYSDINKVDESISDYKKAVELKPDYADAYYNLGYAYLFQKQDYDTALVYYQRSLKYKPDDAAANYAAGLIYLQKNNPEVALKYIDKSILLSPDAESYFSRGLIYELLGNKDKAQQDFNKVLEISNDAVLRQKAETELKKLK